MKKVLVVIGMLGASCLMANANIQKCAGCHGVNFEKPALGKSKVVKDMSLSQIKDALNGYKDGSYGGPMKGLMKAQLNGVKDVDGLAKAVYEINHKEKKLKDLIVVSHKGKCQEKLEEINKCLDAADTKEDISKCKNEVEDLLDEMSKIEKTPMGCSKCIPEVK